MIKDINAFLSKADFQKFIDAVNELSEKAKKPKLKLDIGKVK